MTLIVSMLYGDSFVLQVTDRRVTTQDGRATFEELSNKSVIHFAHDAVACIGYTGPAFIGTLPTDSWIAWKISGRCGDFAERFFTSGGGALLENPLPPQRHIWQAVKALETELRTSEIARLSVDFEIVIVGWKWSGGRRFKKRPTPFAWSIRKAPGGDFQLQFLDRGRRATATRFIVLPDDNMSQQELEQLIDKCHEAVYDPELPIEENVRPYEHAIVDAIRAVSLRNSYVGANCMSILVLPPNRRRFIRASFLSQIAYRAGDIGETHVPAEYPVGFSPWIVGQPCVHSPMVIVGAGCGFGMGPFKIQVEAPECGDGANQTGWFSQQRRSRPTKP